MKKLLNFILEYQLQIFGCIIPIISYFILVGLCLLRKVSVVNAILILAGILSLMCIILAFTHFSDIIFPIKRT